ncbi:MAG: valine--tRNA ligase [Chloroflexi bacterium]|nr:valine--tRNA ligase [Chloroflexota bacterium]
MTSPEEMAKAYDPAGTEGPIYQLWLDGGYFTARIDPHREPFCIIYPPANVTGELHLGHALVDTIEDCLIRWHRMKGEPTLWLPGVDHAGIATQNVVEKELAKEGVSRHDLGREKFLERVWRWVGQYRRVITHQHFRLGCSLDLSRERFTMDEGPQRAVRTTFVNLYHDGLIYRGERIINWCPRCQTALSDLEVEHREHDEHLWYVRYPLLDDAGNRTDEHIVIATTRPETIVADVAVAVNPKVKRWQKVVGRTALLPVIERRIPIIADEAVDPKFGTGALKITPGHDQLDFEIGERHGLRAIVAVNGDGTMNAEAGPYEGMDRFQCKEVILRDLERLGLLEKTVPHRHAVGHCERCDTMLEPLISKQWFVRAGPLAKPAIEAVKSGRIRIIPRRFLRVYLHWMENIRDWCISRQLWWGHRIPVWYCQECEAEVVPPRDKPFEDPRECPRCGSGKLRQDEDVLDTWFSSALWPHSTLGWPDDTEDLRYFYPTSVLETGYDILFFWVARMIMMGLYNTKDIPFHYVYLHGLIRDQYGRKMTKSLGNVVDPLESIDKYGCDALRYTLATGGARGNDFRLTDEKLEGGRNFANKLWNASRFVIQSIGGERLTLPEAAKAKLRQDWALEDRWIYSRAIRVAREVNRRLGEFRLNEAARLLHDFFWSEYCDWYIEMAKVRLKEGDRSPLSVLASVLRDVLLLLHPFMPFVTEAVWQHLRSRLEEAPEAAVVAAYPQGTAEPDPEAEASIQVVMDVVRAIRNIRAERRVDASRWVEAYVAADEARPTVEAARPVVETLARVRPLHIVENGRRLPKDRVATAVLSQGQVAVPLAGLLDVEGERQRLSRQLAEAEAEVRRIEGKLADGQFRRKAPAAVVAREEERLAAARSRREGLSGRLAELT